MKTVKSVKLGKKTYKIVKDKEHYFVKVSQERMLVGSFDVFKFKDIGEAEDAITVDQESQFFDDCD